MDNLCHTLVGAALGEAGLARRKPLATATLLIGANLPDADGLTYVFLDGPTSLAFRRGWTHGILAMAVLPVALAGAMVGWDQMVRRRPEKSRGQALRACTRRSSKIPARFRALLLPAFAAVLSHPLLDFLNTYGVRFLFPFSKRWFYGDTLFIVDPWMWIALAIGITFSRVLRRRGARAETPARIALSVVLAYIVILMVSSFGGRTIVRRAAVRAGLHPSGRVLVSPSPLVPFRRTVVVEVPGGYRFGELRWVPRPVVRFSDEFQAVNDTDPAVAAAKRLRPIRQFLVWARFPYFDVRPRTDASLVTAADARYRGPTGSWASVTAAVPAKPTGRAPPIPGRY